uniref:Uncharacterized protein n=1 Tax=Anguilla anguilla TaxID=7936 RepID=A0A0E9S7P8_ANGAN
MDLNICTGVPLILLYLIATESFIQIQISGIKNCK